MLRIGLLVAITLVALSGCSSDSGNPPTYPVTGVVKFKDKPVEGATIVFVPTTPQAKAASGQSDAQGNYKMGTFGQGDGVVSGSYKVKVTKWEGLEPAEGKVYMDADAESEIYKEGDVVRAPKNVLPAKFANEDASGFTITVGDKATTLDLPLK
jgi:hypothetical protein